MKERTNCRNLNGSITVEATLILLMFFTAFILLMDLTNYVRAQTLMQYTADQTAKELSRYGYLLEKMGILKQLQSTQEEQAAVEGKTEELMTSFEWMQNVMSGVNSGSLSQGQNNLNQSVSIVQGYASDPKSLVGDLLKIVKGKAEQEIANGATGQLSSWMVKSHLQSANGNMDSYLKNLGVVDGIGGLSYADSSYNIAEQTISVVITYKMKRKFGFFELEEKTFTVKGVTRIWSGK